MADAALPGAVFNQDTTGLPLDSQPVSTATGLEAQFGAAMRSSLGVSLETKAIGLIQGGEMIPYDTVKGVFENQKLDPTVFPKGQPIRRGEALAVFGQQLAIQKDQDLADRAHLGGFTGGAAGFVGGLADPAIIGGGLIAGPLLGAARAGLGGATAVRAGASLGVRAATGAAEGGAFVASYEKAEQKYGMAQGDRDITTGQIVHDVLWGSVLGGAIKGAIGARPSRVDLEPYRNMIVGAENTVGYAKAHGMNPDEVVSSKGAVGLHQITPDTAKSLGFSGDTEALKDPAYNAEVAHANLEKLYKQFGSDPEAIAVAWNGGPGLARKFIKAGRDRSILPKETQDYLARIDKLKGAGDVAPEATPPAVSVAARDQGLVVARKMPDGTVQYGERGMIHADLLSEEEFDQIDKEGGFVSSGGPGVDLLFPKHGEMGFAEPGGPFMNRHEAANFMGVGNRLGGLESMHNEELLAKRGIPDATDVASAKTAVAQAASNSEINVRPVMQAMLDEKAGLKPSTDITTAAPVRDSAFINPAKARLEAMDRQAKARTPEPIAPIAGREPHPAVAQLQALAEQAKQEAQSIHQGLTGEAKGVEGNKFETEMHEEEADRVRAEGPDDLHKAIETGVQCALSKGVE